MSIKIPKQLHKWHNVHKLSHEASHFLIYTFPRLSVCSLYIFSNCFTFLLILICSSIFFHNLPPTDAGCLYTRPFNVIFIKVFSDGKICWSGLSSLNLVRIHSWTLHLVQGLVEARCRTVTVKKTAKEGR